MKAYNLDLWNSGEQPVIAATTAIAFGIHCEHIKFVIFHIGTFGLIPFIQEDT